MSGKLFITSVIIDSLMALAVKKTKGLYFKHYFRLSDEVSDESKQFLFENCFDKPKNLIIRFHKTL